MRWTPRKLTRETDPGQLQWRRWFAWYPIQLGMWHEHYVNSTWVWLEWVERCYQRSGSNTKYSCYREIAEKPPGG